MTVLPISETTATRSIPWSPSRRMYRQTGSTQSGI